MLNVVTIEAITILIVLPIMESILLRSSSIDISIITEVVRMCWKNEKDQPVPFYPSW